MEQQHQVVAEGLHAVEDGLAAWEPSADAAARDALADALLRHREELLVHLDEEETSVLPLVSEHITVAEWLQLSERALAETPKDKQLFVLGALLEEAAPQERATFLGQLPVVAKLAWHLVGKRAYAKRMRNVRTP